MNIAKSSPDNLFLRACRFEPVERPPVWMMRQAGRYLAEYRAVREKLSFLDLCRDPEAAAEVTMQPIRRFDFDAAIIFSDILFPLIVMGADFRFGEGAPYLPEKFDPADIPRKLVPKDARTELPWALEALSLVRGQLDRSKALLGFAGAPFTLLAYLVEGETSRLFPKTRALLMKDPQLAHSILGMLADQIAEYMVAQLEAGADAVQLFDTWAGLLSPDDFEEFALPHARRVFERVNAAGSPTIYYINGGAALLPQQATAGSTIVSVDWRVRLSDVCKQVPETKGLQGNLDPITLLGPTDVVRERTTRMLESMRGRRGYIANLGHGVTPPTPIENVAAFVETVQSWRDTTVPSGS